MVIDLGPIIYMILLVYAVCGIFLVGLLSLGTWGLMKYVKRVREKYAGTRENRQLIRPFSHSHQHH